MTPEQLEEIPGIGEKTLEKISVAVRHYFGQYEEGEERPESLVPGREDTSELLAEHEVHPEVDGDESVIEDSVEEVRDEEVGEKKFDE
jgi:N utilization substance protein A